MSTERKLTLKQTRASGLRAMLLDEARAFDRLGCADEADRCRKAAELMEANRDSLGGKTEQIRGGGNRAA